MSSPFRLRSDFTPRGDQPEAIRKLVAGIEQGHRCQTLLGITGSGKTFTVANVIQKMGRPTLIIAPNKTLAAQLYGEMKDLFPDNAVAYFVSYYDYYQPEAYIPSSDTFIEKDAIINDQIDRMRHAATQALLSRPDVIIVASVSCIYGIGSAESYQGLLIQIERGQEMRRDELLRRLVDIQYERNDIDFHRGCFRVRGDIVEIFPVYEEALAIRVEFFGDEVEAISEVDPLRGRVLGSLDKYSVFPGSHYVTPQQHMRRAIDNIRAELRDRLEYLDKEVRFLEKQRLEQRTQYDLEMLETMGFVQGIENYSRHLSGRSPGDPPPTLIDYFPDDFLLVIDESHQTVPQIGAMYRGDRSRKETLVEFGFRLPSALDNRPLKFDEFEQHMKTVLFVSATPGDYELQNSDGEPVEQLIRPTGLIDPEIELRPVAGQVDDLLEEIRLRVEADERVLVTTLTKRMAEDLTEYYAELNIRVRYLHSDVETLERIELLRSLRAGEFDVLVGINLLREGLDLPEVSLVAILDADKEGFLRSARSLIQTIGRAARNARGKVLMYADRITPSMKQAIDETTRRRAIQEAYNAEHGITPETVKRAILEVSPSAGTSDYYAVPKGPSRAKDGKSESPADEAALAERLEELRQEMFSAAENLDFEKAARCRDEIKRLTGNSPADEPASGPRSRGPQSAAASSRPRGKLGKAGPASSKPSSRGKRGGAAPSSGGRKRR
ncbi:MAG: excinuclease ABC subunit UvrB [Polyangiaceae bacterium]|nr:excinuclease ABC subunit UvrB [Polyangiaceae bacterium]MCB9610127.1 excinuclease ABC subunit UvrB [Polyangiaceae bacterium]